MKPMTIVVLVAAAVAAGVAAWVVDRAGRPTPGTTVRTGDRLFEGLSARVNDVASITVKKPAAEFTVTRKDGQWGLESKGGYPVKVEEVKGLIVGMAELRPVEPKTSRPENYSKIGVQDPDAPGAAAPPAPTPTSPEDFTPPAASPTLVTLKDASGAVLAAAILGTQKWGTPPEVYLRKPGEQQSWLAQGRLEVPADAMGWLDRQILNIGRERIKSATVTHPDGQAVTVSKEAAADPSFKVQGVPEGRELTTPTAGESLGSALSYFSIEDVAPAEQLDLSAPGVTPGAAAEFRTFDGVTIRVQTANKEGKTWALFETSYTAPPAAETPPPPPPVPAPEGAAEKLEQAKADAAKKEAEELGAKLGKWAFVLPEYKAKTFQTKIDELLKPLPGAPADPNAPAGPQPVLPPGLPGTPPPPGG